jgi:hypothetical protein
VGLTRQEVIALLGEPRRTEYFKEFDIVYYLGPQRGFMGIDSEWLVLKLNPDGRVKKAAVAMTERISDSSGVLVLVSSIWLQFIWLAVGSTVKNVGLSKVK